jgi:ParB family transcriptional regulator, chromosome partitioning protein
MTRKALGRGLNALLREAEQPPSLEGLQEVPLNLIDPNPFQPRSGLSDEALEELTNSIRASGVLQPVLVRPAGERYQLVAGERRWRAAANAGIKRVPAIVRTITDAEALELALTENLLREALNPLDVARAYEQLQQRFKLTHEQIAERLGVNRSTVTNTFRLLTLPSDVQQLLAEGKITAGHARALVAIESAQTQSTLAKVAAQKGLSVRYLENLAAHEASPARSEPAKRRAKIDPNFRAAVMDLERALGTRVRIIGAEKRGKIEISYYSPEDLNRIYEWILRK